MVSLLEISKRGSSKEIEVSGVKVTMYGITTNKLVDLLFRFPELRRALAERAIELTADQAMEFGKEIVAALIVAGLRKTEDEREAEEAAVFDLPPGDILEMLTTIFDLSFPRGVGPFVKRLEDLGILSPNALDDIGKAPDTKLPLPSSSASPKAMAQKPPGNTPQSSSLDGQSLSSDAA